MSTTVNDPVKPCPSPEFHTPTPEEHVQRAEWAGRTRGTLDVKRCPGCGLWLVWTPRVDTTVPDETITDGRWSIWDDGCPGCRGDLAGIVDRVCANCREQLAEAVGEGREGLDIELRPEVAAFALVMERKLRANDAKKGRGGWKGDHPAALVHRCREEVDEMAVALTAPATLLNECADVANMAMMVADAAGVLGVPRG